MIELGEGNPDFKPVKDGRAQLPVAPTVRLLSVADVVLPVLDGHQRWLDQFYVRVMGFEAVWPEEGGGGLKVVYPETIAGARRKEEKLPGYGPEDSPVRPGGRVYRGENFSLRYELVDAITPEQLKLVQFDVLSLADVSQAMLDREMEYERFKGIMAGIVYLQVSDPVGHVLQIYEGGRLPM